MSPRSIRTAIFPVAGLGTRFLPATKAVPKELLPVLDTPLIQYAIDEARDAGVERMIFVSHPSKSAIKRHVMDDAELRSTLKARGKSDIAEQLQDAAIDETDQEVVFVMQEEPLGLGHAILCAKDHVLPGPVAVVLPDDLILGGTGCLKQMVDAYDGCGAKNMAATIDVPKDAVGSYGIMSVEARDGPFAYCDAIIEKPKPADAPSTNAVVGRYILDSSIFDTLETQPPGAGGEIQLTDAMARAIDTEGLAGFRFAGQRFDCGSKAGMLEAQLFLASQDNEFADVIERFIVANDTAKVA